MTTRWRFSVSGSTMFQLGKVTRTLLSGIIFSFFLVCPGLLDFATPGSKSFAQTVSFPCIEKILQPEFLNGLDQGTEKVKIVVQLKGAQSFKGLSIADDAVLMKSVQATIRSRQDRVLNGLDENQFQLTHRFQNTLGFTGEATLEVIKELAGMDEVAFIEKDREMEMHTSEGIPLIKANELHTLGYYGSGISIAICDSGVDYTHPELGGGGFPNTKVIGGYDIADSDSDPMPTNNSSAHGTACAGIAAGDSGGGYAGGVAPSAKIYALKVFKDSGTGTLGDTAAAWDWCVTHKNDDSSNPILIISNSVGAVNAYQTATCDSGGYSFFATAAATAVSNGMTIFASSGNDGYCDATTAPACNTDVISVGSVYDADFGQHPPSGYVGCISTLSCIGFTSGCPCSTGNCYIDSSTAADVVPSYSNSASFLDILAASNKANTADMVGSNGYSSGNYYSSFGGTSAACPYAAGAGALLQEYAKAQNGSYLTPSQLKSKLVTYGDPVTDSKSSITTPRVNVLASAAAIGGPITTSSSVHTTTTTTVGGGCPPDYPIDCGNSWCCPTSHPFCGYGDEEGLCFSDTTTTISSQGSCEGYCGAESPDGCFCDELCHIFGDCCPDKCELCPGSLCDADGDGVPDDVDNCPATPNGLGGGTCVLDNTFSCTTNSDCACFGPCSADQEDTDEDGVGDVCDSCFEVPNGPDRGSCFNYFTQEVWGECFDADHSSCRNNDNEIYKWCDTIQNDLDSDGIGDVCDPTPLP